MAKTNYDERIEKLAEDYVDSNYDSFTKGKDYASLEKRYSDQGRRAMDDTVGQVAARTGGLASSYAASAGQQAYGEYMGRLEDAARGLYDSQQSERLSKLGVARDMQEHQRSEAERALGDFSNDVYMDMYLAGDEDLAKMTYGDLTKRRTAIPEGFDERDFEMLRRQAMAARSAGVSESGTDYGSFDSDSWKTTMDNDLNTEALESGKWQPNLLKNYEAVYGESYFANKFAGWNEDELKFYTEALRSTDEDNKVLKNEIISTFDKIMKSWIAYDEQGMWDYVISLPEDHPFAVYMDTVKSE